MLIDAHAHLDRYLYKGFGQDIDSALRQINKHKILTISNSMDLTSYRTTLRIARSNGHVVPAFGIHPRNAHKYVNETVLVEKMIDRADVVGEIGLDYFYVKDKRQHAAQRKIFSLFLSKAKAKIISVHTKGAEMDVLNLLRAEENEKVIVHWFSGDLDILKEMISEGYYFSISPEIECSSHIREIAKRIPLKQLLTETDSPGGPASYSRKRGMPILIRKVVDVLAEIRGATSGRIEKAVQDNLNRLASPFSESIFPNCSQAHNRSE
jgi:TatD DNase family protein